MDVIGIGETMVLFTPQSNGLMRYARNFSSRFAGAETNTLIGLSRLGYKTGWISKVGKDEFGKYIVSSIRGEGVDVSQVTEDEYAPTGVFFKSILNEKNIKIYYYREGSAASKLTLSDISENYISKSKYLHVTGITPALSKECYDSIFYAVELAKRHNVKVVFDPNIRYKLWKDMNFAKKTIIKLANMSDIVLPGINEGKFLFGTDDYRKIGENFLNGGAKQVVIKLGARGAYYATPNEEDMVPGIKVDNVIDPIGAGDGFAAGVLSGLLDGFNFKKSVERGCIIGAIVTTVSGDIEGLPDREALMQYVISSDKDEVNR